MKIARMNEETQKKIRQTVRLIFDLYDVNEIDRLIGLNSLFSAMFTLLKQGGIKQNEFEAIMDELKKQYALDCEV